MLWICDAIWFCSVPVNAPMNNPPKLQRMPPPREMSALSSWVTVTLFAAIRVVPTVASCANWICASILRSGVLPLVVSIPTVQLMPEYLMGRFILVFTRARIVRSSRFAPCAGTSASRGWSVGRLTRSICSGPHIAAGIPLTQQISGLPPQLPGTLKSITPFIALPTSGPMSFAGSALIAASAVGVTRIWPAFGVRLAAGKPPGIGCIPQPPQPPPHPDSARTMEVSTTTQSKRRLFMDPSTWVSPDWTPRVKRPLTRADPLCALLPPVREAPVSPTHRVRSLYSTWPPTTR